MDESVTKNKNSEVNGEVEEIFSVFDDEYKKLRSRITEEIEDYKNSLSVERKRADNLKKKIQPRVIMDAILPILSDIKNNVFDAKDLGEVKKIIEIRFKQLQIALGGVGIKLTEHARNEHIEGTEKVNGELVETKDPALHQTVAKTNKMGCIIRGEEDDPILEDVAIYVYKEPMPKSVVENVGTKPDGQNVVKTLLPNPQTSTVNNVQTNVQELIPAVKTIEEKFDAIWVTDSELELRETLMIKDGSRIIRLSRLGKRIKLNGIWAVPVPQELIGRSGGVYFGKIKLMDATFSSEYKIYYRVVKDEGGIRFELLNSANMREVLSFCKIKTN